MQNNSCSPSFLFFSLTGLTISICFTAKYVFTCKEFEFVTSGGTGKGVDEAWTHGDGETAKSFNSNGIVAIRGHTQGG